MQKTRAGQRKGERVAAKERRRDILRQEEALRTYDVRGAAEKGGARSAYIIFRTRGAGVRGGVCAKY